MSRRWDVFLAHASEDKSIARRLVAELRGRGLAVWFDEAEIRIGDSLRRKIDEGLGRSRFGVVLLSPAFFRKEWPQQELDALFAKESAPGSRVLPVRHEITPDAVAEKSPMLGDRYSPDTEGGVRSVADAIMTRLAEGDDSIGDSPSKADARSDWVAGSGDGDAESLMQRLARRLLADFSDSGIHAGEFGQTASMLEQGQWAAGGPDRVAVKPWYYLSYWGVRGLARADRAALEGISDVIVAGIERRIGNRWVEVALQRHATYDTQPGEPDVVLAKSYRHTVRAANILLLLDRDHRLVGQVASDLSELEIQHANGGWPQCDRVFVDEDLWASAYFVRFVSEMEKCKAGEGYSFGLPTKLMEDLRHRSDRTADYIFEEWERSQWEYRGMPPAVAVPKLLIDIGPFVRWESGGFTEAIAGFLLAQITSAGRVKEPETLARQGIPECKQLIRIALGLTMLDEYAALDLSEDVGVIRQSALNLLSGNLDLGPEDLSFAIHLAARVHG